MEARGGLSLRTSIGALLIATIAFAPLAIGTVHPWPRLIVFAAAGVALVLTLVERKLSAKRFSVTVPLVALGAAVLATALQLVPCPPQAIENLSPAVYGVRALQGQFSLAPLTLEPSATIGELAKLCAYLAFFAACTTYASRSHRRRHLIVAVVGVATLVAVIALVQLALGATKILGFYEPRATWAARAAHGTFVNPNHFGALMALAAPCALVLAMISARGRWLLYLASFVINVAAVLSLARATILALAFGQLLVFVLDRIWVRRGSAFLGTPAASRRTLAVIVAAAAVMAVAIGSSRLLGQVEETAALEDLHDPLSKLHVWQASTQLVLDSPWTGIGRGAFEEAFPRVSSVGGKIRYQYVENGYLEAAVDWGVPVALLLALLAAWALRLALPRVREEPLALGALAGVMALAVHEAADFAVELPGVALPALAVLSTLFSHRSAEPIAGRRRVEVRWEYLALAALLIVPAVWDRLTRSAEADEAALAQLATSREVSTRTFLEQADRAWERHPSDYFLCLRVAEKLARDRHPSALRWVNAAMYLNPMHPAPHVMAAEILATSDHKAQALIEYRLAAAGARDPRTEVWTAVLRRYPATEDLLAATHDEPGFYLTLGKWLVGLGRPLDADTVYAKGLEHHPTNARLLERAARLAIDRHDVELAHSRVEALRALGDSAAARTLAAEERVIAGDLPHAADLLDAAHEQTQEAFQAELRLALAYAAQGDFTAARSRLDQVGGWRLDDSERADLHSMRAQVEHLAGNEHQSRWEQDQAQRLRSP